MLSPKVGRLSIGQHMLVAPSVVIVYMQYGKALAQSIDILTEIFTHYVSVSYVKAEAKYVLARLLVKSVNIIARLVGIAAAAVYYVLFA